MALMRILTNPCIERTYLLKFNITIDHLFIIKIGMKSFIYCLIDGLSLGRTYSVLVSNVKHCVG